MAKAPSCGAVRLDNPPKNVPIADLHAESITASPAINFSLVWFYFFIFSPSHFLTVSFPT
jgi:hypothetical protein